MIEGALKLSEKNVRDVMTPINHVFTVCEEEIIDYDFMGRVSDAGYSRIPVTKRGGRNSDITGMLMLIYSIDFYLFNSFYNFRSRNHRFS